MGNLFGGPDMPHELQNRTNSALHKVASANIDELLSRDMDGLVAEYGELFEPAIVRWDEVTMTEPKQIVSHGRQAAMSTFKVSVDGDARMLLYRSHSGAPMFSTISGTPKPGSVEFEWTGELGTTGPALREWFSQRRAHVETFLRNNNHDTIAMNDQMRQSIRQNIEQRRAQELQRRHLTASLPFPVERKEGASMPVRVERRTVHLQQRPAPAPFAPEPELEQAVYEDILHDCAAMATVFERMPLAPGTHEEHLRNTLLGMLNTNFRGQVGGELFNGAGKTDILIRHDDRNVFIGECKFFKGPKSVGDALDQLLRYVVWRDTKAALLLFVRNGNFTEVVTTAVESVAAHPQCQKQLPTVEPSRRSDYIFHRADDSHRAIHLALLPFQLTT